MRRANPLERGSGSRKQVAILGAFTILLTVACVSLLKEVALFDLSAFSSFDARCTGSRCYAKHLAPQIDLQHQQATNNDRSLPSVARADAIPTLVLMQPSQNGWRSTGEVIRVHRPFSLAPPTEEHQSQGSDNGPPLSCFDFAGNVTVTTKPRRLMDDDACKEFLAKQEWEGTYASYGNVTSYSSSVTHTCENTTALIVPLSWRDSNVCHLLMKFLLAFNVYKRIRHTPEWLRGLPPVSNLIVLASNRRDHPLVLDRKKFHGGFLHALFSSHGINVQIATDIPALAKRRTCFSAGVFIGSHANRFAFPDALLGTNAGYETASPAPSAVSPTSEALPSRVSPLSSDAYALRPHVFSTHPRGHVEPPRSVNKLLYVTRTGAGRRRWNTAGELKMLHMLRDVALSNGVKLAVFKGRSGMNFWDQVTYFQDAAVIVGFHGAGLALGAFAPPGAVLVEIEPDYHRLNLFGNLQSSGLLYEKLTLTQGTMDEPNQSSRLIDVDKKRIRAAIERRLLERMGT